MEFLRSKNGFRELAAGIASPLGYTLCSTNPLILDRYADLLQTEATIEAIERLIRRDPARRGLISSESTMAPLCLGQLLQAAQHLAQQGKRAIIVTGFFIPGASPPAAETDGPPGAALLATALNQAGIPTEIATDEPCRAAVEVAAEQIGLPRSKVVSAPEEPHNFEPWCDQFLRQTSRLPPLTHLISLERAGPSHTYESVRSQLQSDSAANKETLQLFNKLSPETDQNRCYNMRGECIDAHTAPLHRLFEVGATLPGVKTIGIGDGGNEIGMGNIPWNELHRRLNHPNSARIPCRIATDWTILAGVSNWGGQALAAATLLFMNKTELLKTWTAEHQLELLTRLVKEGPAVDGITRQQATTVDGLPSLTYIQPWKDIRRLLKLDS